MLSELWDLMLWDMVHRMLVILRLGTQKRNGVWLVLEQSLGLDDRDVGAV